MPPRTGPRRRGCGRALKLAPEYLCWGVKRFLAGRGQFRHPGRGADGDGIQLHYQLPHYRYQRYFTRFAAGAQAPVKLPQARPCPPRMRRRPCLPSCRQSDPVRAARLPGWPPSASPSRPAISSSSQGMCRCATSCCRRRSRSFSPARNPASPSPASEGRVGGQGKGGTVSGQGPGVQFSG